MGMTIDEAIRYYEDKNGSRSGVDPAFWDDTDLHAWSDNSAIIAACDYTKNTECKKIHCQKECVLTGKTQYMLRNDLRNERCT